MIENCKKCSAGFLKHEFVDPRGRKTFICDKQTAGGDCRMPSCLECKFKDFGSNVLLKNCNKCAQGFEFVVVTDASGKKTNECKE